MERVALCLALFVLLLSPQANADPCLSADADKALSCDGKAKQSVTGRKKVIITPPKADPPAKPDALEKPSSPTGVTSTTPRHMRVWRGVERKLLLQEIANVSRLLKNTKQSSSEKPGLMRRLAENYVELESSLYREQIEKETFADEIRRLNRVRSAKFRKEAKNIKKRVAKTRKNAIKLYKKLAKNHAAFCRRPGANKPEDRGCGDEVLYYLAYEYEQAKALGKARDVYLKLIKDWPKSRFVPSAFLAFGELYFNEAMTDPTRWALAQQAYEKVVSYKAPKNKLWGYAAYKLGYVHWNQGRFEKAIDQFKRVIEFGMKHKELPNANGLISAARRDIIPVYALRGDAKKAWRFFDPLSGGNTIKMVEALGRTLMDTGHYRQAIVAHRELMTRNKRKACGYHGQIAKATMAIESGNKKPIVAVLEKQYAQYEKDKSLKCANETAALLAETAMSWHLEAIGSHGVRGTDDPKTKAASAELYKLVSYGFEPKQFAKFKFPRIVKEDWPTLSRVRYAYGDLLYEQGDWEACGRIMGAAYDADPNSKDAPESLFTAALCWQKVVLDRYKNDSTAADKISKRELAADERQMMKAFDRYACNIKPPKGDDTAMEKYSEILYARARTWYQAGHFDKAAIAFRQVAMGNPRFDGAATAGMLYLEALNVRFKDNATCIEPMKKDVPQLAKLHCATQAQRDENELACGNLVVVNAHIRRLEAEALVRQKKFKAGCEKYLEIWSDTGKAACLASQPACKGSDEVLYNAAQACQAAHLLAKSIAIRKLLVDPKHNLQSSKLAKKASYEIGANYQAIAVYDLSAKWYEKFALDNPKMERAPAALSDAVVLRLGLGQADKALANARAFGKQYGKRQPQAAAQIAFAIGEHHVSRGDWGPAEKALTSSLKQIEQHATADVRVQAFALLGRIYDNIERPRKADDHYGKVRKVGDNVAGLKNAIDKIKEPKSRLQRRFGKALSAIGESYFYFAEKERKIAEAMAFPRYTGDRSVIHVKRFVNTKVGDWMKRKKPALERATTAYKKIVKLNGQHPPPRWAIAAGAAVGDMWGTLVNEFIAAPYPKEWDQPGMIPNVTPPTPWSALRAEYQAKLAEAVEPYKVFAKSVYNECLEYGILYQYFDGELRSCEQWLARNYPNEYHMVDEFRGSPSKVNSGLDERPQALSVSGKPK